MDYESYIQREVSGFYGNLQSIDLCCEGVEDPGLRRGVCTRPPGRERWDLGAQISSGAVVATFHQSTATETQGVLDVFSHGVCREDPVVSVHQVRHRTPAVVLQRHGNGLQGAAESLQAQETLFLGAAKSRRRLCELAQDLQAGLDRKAGSNNTEPPRSQLQTSPCV